MPMLGVPSHSKGQKTVGHARASLILANNFLPLNEALGINGVFEHCVSC
jgi:hypothetical protein